MPQDYLVSLDIASGKQRVKLYYNISDGTWFIARRRGNQYEFFRGESGNSIWHPEEAMVEQDPIRLLQIFTLACGAIAKDYAFADFLRKNYERYAGLLNSFSENRLKRDEELPILVEDGESAQPPQPQEIS